MSRHTTIDRVLALIALTLLAVWSGLALARPAWADGPQTRYVEMFGGQDGTAPANDCTDRAAPCATVRHAITVAVAGDTISIGKGWYKESTAIGKSLRDPDRGRGVHGDGQRERPGHQGVHPGHR